MDMGDEFNSANLAAFYSNWSKKNPEDVDFDIQSASRKAEAIVRLMPSRFYPAFTSIIDFGCGYGAVTKRLSELVGGHLEKAVGVDFSEEAIKKARERGKALEHIRYEKLQSLDAEA